jgi:hypothetical protein
MRSFLFCTSYFESEEQFRRYRKWLAFHLSVPLAVEKLFLIDDGSPYTPADPLLLWTEKLPNDLPSQPAIGFRFPRRLGRAHIGNYPGWWRSFFFSIEIADRYGFPKIVHVESDSFVLSTALTDWINSLRTGWNVLWCPFYQVPETCIQIICEDRFPALRELAARDYTSEFAGQYAENFLPFTRVERNFSGNRYNEFRSTIPSFADYAAQCSVETPVTFRRKMVEIPTAPT